MVFLLIDLTVDDDVQFFETILEVSPPPPRVHRPVNYQKVTVRPPSGRCARRSVDKGGGGY